MDWVNFVQDQVQWLACVYTTMTRLVSQNEKVFWRTDSWCSIILLCV